jgi:hypothetical protein
MDPDRVQEIDRKIRRYKGIDDLLNQDSYKDDQDASAQRENDGTAPQKTQEDENEQS